MASAVLLGEKFYTTPIEDVQELAAMCIAPVFNPECPDELENSLVEDLFLQRVDHIQHGATTKMFTIWPNARFIVEVDASLVTIHKFADLGMAYDY